jgi:PNKP adenylyltransferase domain, ligase domain/Calcineurin-like phosphoesterase/AAA domain
MEINIPIHTVITLVGPTYSGKTKLSKKLVSELKVKYPDLNFHIVSSDAIRKELIGEDLPKHSNEMLHASSLAFDLLYFKLKSLLTFPLSLKNAVVIIDTTGLTEDFRNCINKIADEFHYHKAALVMNYKDYDDYFKLINSAPEEYVDQKIITNHIKRLRKRALPQITKKAYPQGRFLIKEISENWKEVSINLSNYQEYIDCKLPTHTEGSELIEYTILPDTHGCYDETIGCLSQSGFQIVDGIIINPGNKRIVCLGDYTDKGPQVKELINFLYGNKSLIYFCLGNHEDFVVRYLKGEIEAKSDVLNYFDSITWLEGTPELDRLNELHSISQPFYIHPEFICTHAPTRFSRLGKLDKDSIKSQYKLSYSYSEDYSSEGEYKKALERSLSFIKNQGGYSNLPYIISGHVPVKQRLVVGAQVMLDTGVVYGNKLTTCTIKGKHLSFNYFNAKSPYSETKYLVTLFDEKEDINLLELEPREYRRIRNCLGNKPTVWFAPTMSPSNSNDTDLEPLKTALDYYQSKDVTDLVMQPKYMGSNAVFVWKPNTDDCYMTTRNGFLIQTHSVDISLIINKFHPLILKEFPGATLVAVSGELLPWKVLGEGLIDEHFNPIYLGMKAELEFCKENGFNEALYSLLSVAKKEFSQDRITVSKGDLRKKYGDAKVEWYNSALQHSKYVRDVNTDLTEVEAYKTELDGYTQNGIPEFKPFQVLKVEKEDSVHVLPFDNLDGFKLLNNSPVIKIDLNKDNYDYLDWVYQTWVSNSQGLFGYSKLEGVVIKPLDSHLSNVAPFIKVRNPQYLKLVYGPTYNLEPNYSKLLRTKTTSGKIKSSIKEWNLSLELLGIHSSKLTLDNQKAIQLILEFIKEEKNVELLDPRL